MKAIATAIHNNTTRRRTVSSTLLPRRLDSAARGFILGSSSNWRQQQQQQQQQSPQRIDKNNLHHHHSYCTWMKQPQQRPAQDHHRPKSFPLSAVLQQQQQRRWFESEAAYHDVADESLEFLQDSVEDVLETLLSSNSKTTTATLDSDDVEVTLAAGVLTLHIPPHGTWVINKQTPNQQLWWSSPLSGPKRYEYEDDIWISTKDGLALVPFLSQELSHILGETINLEDYHH